MDGVGGDVRAKRTSLRISELQIDRNEETVRALISRDRLTERRLLSLATERAMQCTQIGNRFGLKSIAIIINNYYYYQGLDSSVADEQKINT